MLTKADIEKYFIAEKGESLLFLIIGLAAIVLVIFSYLSLKTSFWKGAAIPLLLIGIIQAIVGYTVYARSDEQRINNVYAYDMNPDRLRNEELPRMQAVNKRFTLYRWIEIVFIICGLILVFVQRNESPRSFWYGLGLALAIQSAIMLAADYFAEKRAQVYANQLQDFVKDKKTTG